MLVFNMAKWVQQIIVLLKKITGALISALLFVTVGFKNSDMINLRKSLNRICREACSRWRVQPQHFFAALLFFGSCTNDLKDVMALPTNKKTPSQIGDSVTLLYTDSSQLKVILKANR